MVNFFLKLAPLFSKNYLKMSNKQLYSLPHATVIYKLKKKTLLGLKSNLLLFLEGRDPRPGIHPLFAPLLQNPDTWLFGGSHGDQQLLLCRS